MNLIQVKKVTTNSILSLQTADRTAAFGYFVRRNYANEVCEDTSPTSPRVGRRTSISGLPWLPVVLDE